MNKKIFYVSPYLEVMEINQEGVLCASEKSGDVAQLNPKYDWADDMWNE